MTRFPASPWLLSESLVAQIVQKTLQQKQSSWDAQIQQVKQKLAEPYDTTARSLADVAMDLAAQVPEEDCAKVPTDASIRYKQYLYGMPSEHE